ncbi:MAG: TIGR03915 family putative DNA repair protein [Bacteroidaceae bacterium]|nr:TIGR03915 family putative DNA repair protein [Bacteroidaceae bacterium]
MLVYTFDRTMDGVLSAVFDAYSLRQRPEVLIGEGEPLPLFCDESHRVTTTEEKARRVWKGLEKYLSHEAMRMLAVSYLSEDRELDTPLFHYIYKVFEAKRSIERNFADPDVLFVTNTARRVMHERLRMMQFIRFQKAQDGTYLGVVHPDHNVLPLIIDHFRDRFQDQPWLIYDARRQYGYYFDQREVTRVTFEDTSSLPFDLRTGQLSEELLSENDQLFQRLWRTYFKAICIKERMNPKKQLNDMPRRYWAYMTEKQ